MKKNFFSFFTILVLVISLIFVFSSCQTIPKDVPDDISEAEIIQKAQESFDFGNNKAAVFYYDLLASRYGEDVRNIIISKYEIAHIYIKTGKIEQAKTLLQEAMSFYDENETKSEEDKITLPPEYKKLIQMDLNRIQKLDTKDNETKEAKTE